MLSIIRPCIGNNILFFDDNLFIIHFTNTETIGASTPIQDVMNEIMICNIIYILGSNILFFDGNLCIVCLILHLRITETFIASTPLQDVININFNCLKEIFKNCTNLI
ncbi:unnamed protein product [Nezara viridula]|uniref:Uncharacterized protein n=1 Tax=Nezara viridula TaxID=85310 RepID=A0A9P0HSP1_NEZVI|nr:unnamed protein product [Nezara viridula]